MIKNKTWKTKDGQTLNISDMETSHIRNCINLLHKRMPDHEENETICADFPESMAHEPCCYTEVGAKYYRNKISEFTEELVKRNEL